jgi:hypothetical protein
MHFLRAGVDKRLDAYKIPHPAATGQGDVMCCTRVPQSGNSGVFCLVPEYTENFAERAKKRQNCNGKRKKPLLVADLQQQGQRGKRMFPVRRGCLKKCMEAQYQFSVYDASHEKIGQEDIEKRKEMYGDNLTDAQLDQLETICDKINAAQYHTIWYRALQLDQSEDGGNLLSETMVQYWNDEITLDELVDRLTPRLKLYLDE